MLLFETSAKDPRESQNVDSIFMALACRLKAQKSLLYRDVEREDGRVRLTQETETKSNCPCWGAPRVGGVIEGKSEDKMVDAKEQEEWGWSKSFNDSVPFGLRLRSSATVCVLSKWRIEVKCKYLACPTDTITGLVLEGEDWSEGGDLDRCNY